MHPTRGGINRALSLDSKPWLASYNSVTRWSPEWIYFLRIKILFYYRKIALSLWINNFWHLSKTSRNPLLPAISTKVLSHPLLVVLLHFLSPRGCLSCSSAYCILQIQKGQMTMPYDGEPLEWSPAHHLVSNQFWGTSPKVCLAKLEPSLLLFLTLIMVHFLPLLAYHIPFISFSSTLANSLPPTDFRLMREKTISGSQLKRHVQIYDQLTSWMEIISILRLIEVSYNNLVK